MKYFLALFLYTITSEALASGPYLDTLIYISLGVILFQVIPIIFNFRRLRKCTNRIHKYLFLISIISLVVLYSGVIGGNDYLGVSLFVTPLIMLIISLISKCH